MQNIQSLQAISPSRKQGAPAAAFSADVFAFETFESGSTPWSFDSVGNIFGAATAALDTTSKVVGANSLAFGATGEGAATAQKLLGATRTEIYVQFKMFLPTGFSPGSAGYMGLLALRTSGDENRVYFNLEQAAGITLTTGGDITTPSTGISLPINQVFTLEIRVKKSATVGNLSIWVNNNDFNNPDYNSGDINSTADAFQKLVFGVIYTEAAGSTYFMDNIAAHSSFIGLGRP